MNHETGAKFIHTTLTISSTSPMRATPLSPLSATAGEASIEVTSLSGGFTASEIPRAFLGASIRARIEHIPPNQRLSSLDRVTSPPIAVVGVTPWDRSKAVVLLPVIRCRTVHPGGLSKLDCAFCPLARWGPVLGCTTMMKGLSEPPHTISPDSTFGRKCIWSHI